MRWNRGVKWYWLVLATGCSSSPMEFSDRRPPTTPAPIDVQQEIRDARYFLAYPDETIGPQTGMLPRQTEVSTTSR
ncbi:MAG: hypothetical protein U1D30_26770 [Planctomycetota bacterium]